MVLFKLSYKIKIQTDYTIDILKLTENKQMQPYQMQLNLFIVLENYKEFLLGRAKA